MNTSAALLAGDPPVALVRPDWALLHEINKLEARINATDGDADDLLWQQAEHVYYLLDAGVISERKLAWSWINPRTKKAHSQRHVQVTREAYADYLTSQWPDSIEVVDGERPRFRDVYNAIANPNFGNGDEHWYTAREIIEAAHAVLGDIDLDPATCPAANSVVGAARIFTEADDGLQQRWCARTLWMNPPFSKKKITAFCDKLVASVQCGDVTEAIVLVRSDTSTKWWTTLSGTATAISFPEGRLQFWKPNIKVKGRSNFGTAIFYFGPQRELFLEVFRRFGLVVVIPEAEQLS